MESANEVPVTRDRAIDLGVLALAVVVGTVLRVVGLGAVGLNSDEAVYAGQAASLVGNPHFTDNFPVIRAHPLLFQLLVSPFYRTGIPEVPGRYVNAFFGVGTIVLVFQLGRLLYGRRVGALAALLLAVMPYHVIITRQVLLDGPMTFFATAALVCLAALARTGPEPLAGRGGQLPRPGVADQGDRGHHDRAGVRLPFARPEVLEAGPLPGLRRCGRHGIGPDLSHRDRSLRRWAERTVVPAVAAEPASQPRLPLLPHCRAGRRWVCCCS